MSRRRALLLPLALAACGGEGLVAPPEGVSWASVTAGSHHTCALTEQGEGYCWGANDAGQLGIASSERIMIRPSRIAGGHRFASLSAGWRHTCGVDVEGGVWCWGEGSSGQLGQEGSTSSPRRVPGVAGATTASAAGAHHTCALLRTGEATCWGDNRSGQLGDGTRRSRAAPGRVQADRSFAAIAAGRGHACGLSTAGEVLCWGANRLGQLGAATERDSPLPVTTTSPASAPWVAVAAGGDHACALTRSGAAWCWGDNTREELVPGGPVVVGVPMPVLEGGVVDLLTPGTAGLTCGVRDRAAWTCWGGPLPAEAGGSVIRPTTLLADDAGFRSLATGDAHACAVTSAGALYCWGAGQAGQLGGIRTDFLEVAAEVR